MAATNLMSRNVNPLMTAFAKVVVRLFAQASFRQVGEPKLSQAREMARVAPHLQIVLSLGVAYPLGYEASRRLNDGGSRRSRIYVGSYEFVRTRRFS